MSNFLSLIPHLQAFFMLIVVLFIVYEVLDHKWWYVFYLALMV
jgi:hypothetical protein